MLEFVPLEDVKEIHLKPQQWSFGPIGGQVTFDTNNGDTVRYMFPRVSNKYLKKGILEPAQALQNAGFINLIMELKAALPKPEATVKNDNQFSAADEILKYKQLLDAGAITQEEFDAKKKQLLNL